MTPAVRAATSKYYYHIKYSPYPCGARGMDCALADSRDLGKIYLWYPNGTFDDLSVEMPVQSQVST